MTSLEKRLAKHFAPADIKAAREITPTRLSCPRVGQVRAIFKAESGETQEVFLELAAGRRGGMTLESRSTTQPGRAGRPCPLLAATLMEIDRRSLFSSIHDHTPVALDVIPADDFEESGEPAQDGLRNLGLPVNSWEHRWIASTPCRVEETSALVGCLKLLDALEELDDVRSVTSNLEADEEIMKAMIT